MKGNPHLRAVRRLAVLIAILGVPTLSLVVYANHNFPDVPTSASYHNAVEWLVNRNITTGCGGGLYCPDDPVSRAQMALFFRRLGIALTPGYIEARGDASGLNLSSDQVICKTAAYTPTFPQRAFIMGDLSIEAPVAGSMDFGHRTVFSTDGGTTFNETPDAWFIRATAPANAYATESSSGSVDLSPATPYIFAIRARQFAGQTTTNEYICSVRVTTYNRNPATSPLRPALDMTQASPGSTNDLP